MLMNFKMQVISLGSNEVPHATVTLSPWGTRISPFSSGVGDTSQSLKAAKAPKIEKVRKNIDVVIDFIAQDISGDFFISKF